MKTMYIREFVVLDEDGELIASIENCPVIVEYQRVAVDIEPETSNSFLFDENEDLPF